MTFAGNVFTEEMERQSRYNVVQIVVKTTTREPRQRYLKVKCTVPNKIDGRITVGMNDLGHMALFFKPKTRTHMVTFLRAR